MKGTRRTASTIALLLALGGAALTMLPSAFAGPINANLTWSPNPVSPPGTPTTATYGVAVDSDCTSGATFSGTLSVTDPNSITTSVTVPGTACGTTTLTSVYPTQFSPEGVGSTRTCGVYTAVWKGTTSILVGGLHPIFNVQNNFIVPCPSTTPEFGAPAMLVAGFGLVLLAAVKKGRVLRI